MNLTLRKSYWPSNPGLSAFSGRVLLSNFWGRIEKHLKLRDSVIGASRYPIELKFDLDRGLKGYSQISKQQARDAVDQLIKCKAKLGHFTDINIIDHPMASMLMARYQFRNVDDLNDWLDGF